MRVALTVNGERHKAEVAADTPLLWVLRDNLGLTGTKYGCGISECGACTVHLDGEAVRACSVTADQADGRAVTTIEGLDDGQGGRHPLQEAWIAENVPQCGFCQPGQIMSAAALLDRTPAPDDAAIDTAMGGNLCRCGTYQRIRRAIHRTAAQAQESEA